VPLHAMRGMRRGNGLYILLLMIYLGRTRVMNKQKKNTTAYRATPSSSYDPSVNMASPGCDLSASALVSASTCSISTPRVSGCALHPARACEGIGATNMEWRYPVGGDLRHSSAGL